MYAIVETGGRQVRVTPKGQARVELLDAGEGDTVTFDRILVLSSETGLKVGTPYVEGALVKAKVIAQDRAKKVDVFKMKDRKGYRRLRGHRQHFTLIQVEEITGG